MAIPDLWFIYTHHEILMFGTAIQLELPFGTGVLVSEKELIRLLFHTLL